MMLRDTIMNVEYFTKGIEFDQKIILRDKDNVRKITRHEGQAGNVSTLCTVSTHLCIQRYGRGDTIEDIKPSVTTMCEMRGLRQDILRGITIDPEVREMWGNLTLNRLYDNLTCLAFVTSLHYSASDVKLLLSWIEQAGTDGLLDRVAVKMGDAKRSVAATSRYATVYDALIQIIEAPKALQASMLSDYVNSWYRRMKIISWHGNDKAAEGAYFGYWCFEAALVAMLWDIDDSAFQGHKHYPADLVKHFRATKPEQSSS